MFRCSVVESKEFYCNRKYRFTHDYELWCRLTFETKFANIDKPLLIYRDNKEISKSNSNRNSFTRELELLKIRFFPS